MYRITIDNMARFNQFLGIVDIEWVNIVLGDRAALFIQDSNEMFAVLQLPCEHGTNDKQQAFRIQKNVLSAVCAEGELELTVISEDVILLEVITSAGFRRRIETEKNKAYTLSFMEKFEVISKAEGNLFNAATLKRVHSVSKLLHSYVEVDNGVAGVMSKGGSRVYSAANGVPNLCLSSKAMAALFSCDNLWTVHRNFVFAAKDLLGVLVTQCRGSGLSDYFVLEQEAGRSALVCDIDLADVLSVLPRLHARELRINARKRLCSVDGKLVSAEFPLKIENMQIAEKYDGEIVISNDAALNLLPKSGILHFSVKRHFTRIDGNDLVILI